jgi:subtilisin family serine protease/RNA polymerase subunit RPABC4/transcription elongation factor Spt4
MISRKNLSLLINQKTVAAMLVLGTVLTLAAGGAYYIYARDQAKSQPEITPPQSLSELADQYPVLAHILTDPELDSVYKEFLVAYQEGGRDAAVELARQRSMLTPGGDVAITLVLDTEDNAALTAQLEAVGIDVASAYRDRVNVSVPMALIDAQVKSAEPGAVFDQLTELEHVIAVQLPEPRRRDGSAILGEGMAVIGADAWREAGITGKGLRIGILDLGFANYEDLLGEELPDEVSVATFGWHDPDEVHGTACAEIIHELAPDAELFFAWYDGNDAAMGEAVEWLLEHGVNIISHSASGIVGPRDGSEWDAQLVDELAAQGVLWVNSSGNEALSHYRGLFTDEDGNNFHEFRPGEETLALYNDGYVDIALSWEDDWEQARQDYELFLYDEAGNELASSQDTQSGEVGQEPVEWISFDTGGETIYAVVTAYESDQAVTLDIFVNGADVAYPSPEYSVCPPSDAVGSLTVGAANWQDDSLAEYSSQGPTADGRLKPEISAPTGVSGVTYGTEEFHGTSSSCPHVAGAAALVWQANPDFTRQEIVDYLLDHATDRGPDGPDTGHGYGRLQLPPPEAPNPAPMPTATPLPTPGPGPTPTPIPLPTPTPVVYTTPESVPITGAGTGLLAVTGLGLATGGLCCAGGGLLLVGGVGLLLLRRRSRRAKQAPLPIPQPQPHVPSPPPPPPTRRKKTPTVEIPPSHPASAGPPLKPVYCQSCGMAMRPGARFCPNCGHASESDRQPRYCRHCGAQLREGARFCPQCGDTTK